MHALLSAYTRHSLVLRIMIGIALGTVIAVATPSLAESIGFLGALFVAALKAVAPILIFVLVLSSLANQQTSKKTNMGDIVVLYVLGTLSAATIAVALSFVFPAQINLVAGDLSHAAPQGITEVLSSLLFRVVDNPISALINGNYVGILAWSIGLGLLMRKAQDASKAFLSDLSDGVTGIVQWVIQLAPLGIMGLVASTIATSGFAVLGDYAHLLTLLVGSMLLMALLINPLIVWYKIRSNPFPIVFSALKESGITAFFTRSSAANIPVNMQLCEKMNLNEDTYSVSIPLGATINMAGAAITISVMTLAAVHTLNIHVDLATALLLCIIASVGACGSSGVAGGSLLLIPLACSLFNIPNEVAMQVVGVGFIIGVVQDSAETALNSSTDVVFTAAVCMSKDA